MLQVLIQPLPLPTTRESEGSVRQAITALKDPRDLYPVQPDSTGMLRPPPPTSVVKRETGLYGMFV